MVYFVCIPMPSVEDAQTMADLMVTQAKMPLSFVGHVDSKAAIDPSFGKDKIIMTFISGSVTKELNKEIIRTQEKNGVLFGGKYC